MTTPSIDAAAIDRNDLEAIIDALFRTSTAVDALTAQMRRAFAMNAHERLAIAALWAEGPMTMTQLGEWIPLSRAAVTTLVDRLEQGGYVSRRSDPGDRRRTVVEVSATALDRMIPVIQPWAASMHGVVDEFDDIEWAAVTRFLDRLRETSNLHAGMLKQLSDEDIQARATGRIVWESEPGGTR